MTERERAEAYIAGARECGLVLFPVVSLGGRIAVGMAGEEQEGPNDLDAATDPFLQHPAVFYRAGLPRGLIVQVLCEDFGVDPADPDLCAKVDARLAADRGARAAAGARR